MRVRHPGKRDSSTQGKELLEKTRCLQCLDWSGLAASPWVGTLPSTTQRNSQLPPGALPH